MKEIHFSQGCNCRTIYDGFNLIHSSEIVLALPTIWFILGYIQEMLHYIVKDEGNK